MQRHLIFPNETVEFTVAARLPPRSNRKDSLRQVGSVTKGRVFMEDFEEERFDVCLVGCSQDVID